MTTDEQLEEWVKGNPIHNNERNECCPDFSCCCPDLLADERTRKEFAAAGDEKRMAMLMMFLSAGFASDGQIVRIAGEAVHYA